MSTLYAIIRYYPANHDRGELYEIDPQPPEFHTVYTIANSILGDHVIGLENVVRIIGIDGETGASTDVTRAVAEIVKRDVFNYYQDTPAYQSAAEKAVGFVEYALGLVWCPDGTLDGCEDSPYCDGRWKRVDMSPRRAAAQASAAEPIAA